MTERMTADEARALLAGMTPGTLSVERAAGIRRLAVPQGDELALVIRDSPREFGGAMYSLEVCRGMDGPTREANAAAFAAVKRALATVAMTAPDDPRAQAGECDVAAIGARAAAAFAAERDAVDSLDEARTETNARDFGAQEREHRALRQNISAARVAADEAMRSLLAWIAAEPARVAAAVAGERARARRCAIYSERFDGYDVIDTLDAVRGMIENGDDDEVCEYCHDTGVNAAASKPCRFCGWAKVLRADALAAPAQGGG